MGETYDFCGWATRNDLKCSDGRIIRKDAFKHCDGMVVPLVYNHDHNEIDNVLGHALLENRDEGVYTYGTFNETEAGQIAKNLVKHGDITHLSIYANQLKQNGHDVIHGAIREVSLVLAGANPGACIETVLAHSDYCDEEAVIYSENEYGIEHTATNGENTLESENEEPEVKKPAKHKKKAKTESSEEEEIEMAHADSEKTIEDVFNAMTEEQKTVVYALVGAALESKGEGENSDEGDDNMKHNVFSDTEDNENVLSHSEMQEIFSDAKRCGSLKDACLEHGINDIEYLFPDYQNLNKTPEFIKRPDGWVTKVMNGVHHTPFSRIKSMFANITEADARARGYIKGNAKVEEVFGLLKRTTDPQTIYKKQKLDRDDVIDITDFDVVSWLKTEMRGMLDEEIARAILVGDGRSSSSDDKISPLHIRPIWGDDELYTIQKTVSVATTATDDQKAKAIIRAAVKARKDYRGSGSPTFYTTEDVLTDMLLIEDTNGRVIYDTVEKLANALRVKEIVTVPVMENLTRTSSGTTYYLTGLIVNLDDYNIGADKGGAVSMFDDFDIDYNAQKYLIETRCSGAMTKPYGAIALEMAYNLVLGVDAESSSTTVLGKVVSDLQSNVIVHDDYIEGKLKYVTGYTGFSGDPAEQSGNYLALKFSATSGATTTIQLLGGLHPDRIVTLDSDMNAVLRITNKNNEKLKVVTTTTAGTITKVFGLSSLKVESA